MDKRHTFTAFLIFLFLLSPAIVCAGEVSGGLLRGRVLDSKSKALPYAGVYFKKYPGQGTVTDEKGCFSLTMSGDVTDTLIVSMLGYRTIFKSAADIRAGRNLTLKMEEEVLSLDGSIVTASRKENRRERNRQIRELLGKVEQRLFGVDCAGRRSFRIASDITISNDESVIMRNRLSGRLYDCSFSGKKGRDTVYMKTESYQSFLKEEVRKGIEDFSETPMKMNSSEEKIYKAFVAPDRKKTTPHTAVWRMNAKSVMKALKDESPVHWGTVTLPDGTISLIYCRKHDFMGMIRANVCFSFEIDPATYAVKKMSGDSDAHIFLPISHKLTPAELKVLNFVNVQEEEISKYRLKKAYFSSKGTMKFRERDGKMIPYDKNLKNTATITDKKGLTMNFTNSCTQIIVE